MSSADEALTRLREGNQRFLEGRCEAAMSNTDRRAALASGQAPFAVIIGCSDSRVPPEVIFDQGLGDLFIVRVAGNLAAPSQIGSVELAATALGSRLVVVLGHSKCAAVVAAVDKLRSGTVFDSPHLRLIIDQIEPSLTTVVTKQDAQDEDALIENAVRANVHGAVRQLRQQSEILDQLVRDDGLQIVGAEYCLDTGRVEFLET